MNEMIKKDIFDDTAELTPYASVNVGLLQPLGGWVGRTAVERLLELERKTLPTLIEKMKSDWEKVCNRYFGTPLWETSLSQMYVSQFPKILAYDQPFLSNLFKRHPDIFRTMISHSLAPNGGVDVQVLRDELSRKLSSLFLLRMAEQNNNGGEQNNDAEGTNRGNVVYEYRMIDLDFGQERREHTANSTQGQQYQIMTGALVSGFGLEDVNAQAFGKILGGSSYTSIKLLGKIRQYAEENPTAVLGTDNIGTVVDAIPGLMQDVQTWISEERMLPTGIDWSVTDIDQAIVADMRHMLEILRKIGFLDGHLPAGNLARSPFGSRTQDRGGKREQPPEPEPDKCSYDEELVSLELYILLLDMPSISRTVQTILSEAFEPLKVYYQSLIRSKMPGKNLEYKDSPIGFIDLYKQYLYDCGNFLGPPIDHIWVAPHSSVEMSESVSLTEYSSQEVETYVESFSERETQESTKEDYLNELQRERESNFSFDASLETSLSLGVFSAKGTASVSYATRSAEASKTVTNRVKEQSERVVERMKKSKRIRSFRSLERAEENVKRRKIENPDDTPNNYEIRRKHQRIGVAMHYIGTRLCWQLYIDEPAALLRLPELVHVLKPEGFDQISPPVTDIPNPEEIIIEDQQFFIPYKPMHVHYRDAEANYRQGIRINDGEVEPEYKIKWQFNQKVKGIPKGYELSQILETSAVVGHGRASESDKPRQPSGVVYEIPSKTVRPDGSFQVNLQFVNFNDAQGFWIVPRITLTPSEVYKTQLQQDALNAAKHETEVYENERRRMLIREFEKARQTLIEVERSIAIRDSLDLRFEERNVVFKSIVSQFKERVRTNNSQELSELFRTLFDIDKMVYYVAPDWWEPKAPAVIYEARASDDPNDGEDHQIYLGKRASECDNAINRGRYYITEESEPARRGSSLGWCLQLDGDDQRNAFLNSSWIRVALPVRPDMEEEALNWLIENESLDDIRRQMHEINVGDNASSEENSECEPNQDVLDEQDLKNALKDEVCSSRNNAQSNIQNNTSSIEFSEPKIMMAEFGQGSDAFAPQGDKGERIATWIEVVPTKQTVAVEVDYHKENGQMVPRY